MEQDDNIATALEPLQRTDATRQKLPRRKLGRFTLIMLYALRVYVIVAVPVVVYAFIRALNGSP